ncbi:MAG: ribosomal protein S18-alanine N-acetyltransferase [Archaeoglobaceae archaeon]|nr:ribosomal protein S18-alanine N-acetyltransferase [Archaeoglobaceae archaeon]MCX8151684.1 ribosomal protein S18-alanine N-acetyltransferase [Archaeoglobaceae archaeon]MDW8013038.1 ribosomal protein S18-alanine N-acetyltransferase [Archaeoglobaceae archaeon]
MQIVVREYNTKDFKDLLEIDKEAFSSRNPAYDVYIYLTFGSDFLVADIGGKIVGYIATMDVDKNTGKIISFAVKKEFRGKGIGSTLLKRAIERLRTKGKKKILLEVRVSNLQAQRLYKKFGFRIEKVLPSYYSDGESAYLMSLEINEQ